MWPGKMIVEMLSSLNRVVFKARLIMHKALQRNRPGIHILVCGQQAGLPVVRQIRGRTDFLRHDQRASKKERFSADKTPTLPTGGQAEYFRTVVIVKKQFFIGD